MFLQSFASDMFYLFLFFLIVTVILIIPAFRNPQVFMRFFFGFLFASGITGVFSYFLHDEAQDMRKFAQEQNAKEKTETFCAVVNRSWSAQEGGGGNFLFRDPVKTGYFVSYQMPNGLSGSSSIPASQFGLFREGQEITVSHQKTNYVHGYTGLEVWADIVSVGCNK